MNHKLWSQLMIWKSILILVTKMMTSVIFNNQLSPKSKGLLISFLNVRICTLLTIRTLIVDDRFVDKKLTFPCDTSKSILVCTFILERVSKLILIGSNSQPMGNSHWESKDLCLNLATSLWCSRTKEVSRTSICLIFIVNWFFSWTTYGNSLRKVLAGIAI